MKYFAWPRSARRGGAPEGYHTCPRDSHRHGVADGGPRDARPALSASSSANSWEVVASDDDDDGADVTGEEDDTPPHESDTRERRTEQTPSCSSDSSAGSAGASAAMRRLREAMVAEGTREEERTTSTPKRKKNANPRARVSSVCASARRGATATSGCASASVRRWRSPQNSSSRSLLEEEPLRRSTECSVREPSTRSPRGPRRTRTTRRRKRRRKKNLLLVRCFPAFPRVSCFDERRGSRRSRRSRGSANAFASRSLQGGRRRPRRALPRKRSKRTRVERGGGGRRFASRSRRTVVRAERSEFSKPFETASLRGPSFEASWRSPSSPRSRSQRRLAPVWDAPGGASPRARLPRAAARSAARVPPR